MVSYHPIHIADLRDTMRLICGYVDIKSERADIPRLVVQAFEASIAAWRVGRRQTLVLHTGSCHDEVSG